MADVELIIKIPEYLYKAIKAIQSYKVLTEEESAIANGTPLPKGHGRLKDIDKVERLLDLDKLDNIIAKALKTIIESVPTIIEADTAEKERKNDYK